ncbi:MAG TPA: DUF3817 domain-containing protein [Myxococcaceae bacterium]|nr:DUF3817 domain-containing protein [Myxococcaceae bacterium]
MSTPLQRFRLVALLEGLSYVLLVFVAMPLKYLLELPQAVRALGSAHGALFVLFVVLLTHVLVVRQLSFARAALAFVASLVPFGAFWFEAKLRREEAAAGASATAQ